MTFHKVLAKYYHKWFRDCMDSADYCEAKNQPIEAEQYRQDAKKYLAILIEHWEAIDFFSIGDNAFKYDAALPERFKGYK